MITQEKLKEVLNYDQDTGIFTWKIKTCKKVCVGVVAGTPSGDGYSVIKINGKRLRAHRLAWLYVYGEFPDKFIDHINGIRHDNKISNLRNVTKSENSQNQRKPKSDNQSGFLGVHWCKRDKVWIAAIGFNKKTKYLGTYSTPELAHQVYLKAKREIHAGCTI